VPARAPERRDRIARHAAHEREGLRRFRPGRGSTFYSPAMVGTAGTSSRYAAMADADLDREIEVIAVALDEHGPVAISQLQADLDANGWGPGRFQTALREALQEGRATRQNAERYGPPVDTSGNGDRASGATNGASPAP
jgi:hypothetical protein